MRGQSFGFVSFSAFVIEKKGWNTMKHPLTGSPDGKPLVSLLILAVGFSWNAPAAPSAAGYREALNLSVPTATTSNVSLPSKLAVSVGDGARLQLSFAGVQKVDAVQYAGKYLGGPLNQQTHPEFISGPGTLYAAPKGTEVILR